MIDKLIEKIDVCNHRHHVRCTDDGDLEDIKKELQNIKYLQRKKVAPSIERLLLDKKLYKTVATNDRYESAYGLCTENACSYVQFFCAESKKST